ncbi:MAG TPA: Na(+)/H(+) antiporter subunit C [Acidimicrobiales bacterium]|nr:Na(+)/H(+) antiporter subunit C [Acidimicrobiales bacterium]
MTVLLVVVAGALCACGTYLVLGRQLSRVVIGIGLLGHGVNVLIVLSGGDGGDPAFAGGDAERFADPLPQAFVLTAIVITFGVIAFLLTLAYRSWLVTADDEVEDDVEDRRIAREAQHAAAEAQHLNDPETEP